YASVEVPSARSSAAKYQSAVAVNIAAISPTPARLSRSGASSSTSVSAISTSGQRVGVVRFTPDFSSTENGSAYPFTLVAVCTTISGTPESAAALPISQIVPEPTVITQPASAAPFLAAVTVASSACTDPSAGPSATHRSA